MPESTKYQVIVEADQNGEAIELVTLLNSTNSPMLLDTLKEAEEMALMLWGPNGKVRKVTV
jgi:hypothetical protein